VSRLRCRRRPMSGSGQSGGCKALRVSNAGETCPKLQGMDHPGLNLCKLYGVGDRVGIVKSTLAECHDLSTMIVVDAVRPLNVAFTTYVPPV